MSKPTPRSEFLFFNSVSKPTPRSEFYFDSVSKPTLCSEFLFLTPCRSLLCVVKIQPDSMSKSLCSENTFLTPCQSLPHVVNPFRLRVEAYRDKFSIFDILFHDAFVEVDRGGNEGCLPQSLRETIMVFTHNGSLQLIKAETSMADIDDNDLNELGSTDAEILE
ncbi:hypothetical protein CR513_46630, partial [Mucuna pruriens]